MEIWGDGENVRDFIYIGDVVEACTRFIGLPQDNGTYNLGCGIGYSINQVRHIVEEITGAELKISYRPARDVDVRAVVLDINRICRKLHWAPKVELQEGVSLTWEWLRKAP
jgi:UDP-glucose 4-epimerase